jgi:hypothetical protein
MASTKVLWLGIIPSTFSLLHENRGGFYNGKVEGWTIRQAAARLPIWDL